MSPENSVPEAEVVAISEFEAGAGTAYASRPPLALLQRQRRPVPAVHRMEHDRPEVDPVRSELRERLVPEHPDVRLLGRVLIHRLGLSLNLARIRERRDLVDLGVDVRIV